jgi:hypothetical protein
MRALVFVLLLASCGGSPKPPAPPTAPPVAGSGSGSAAPPPAAVEVTPVTACKGYALHHAQRCPGFEEAVDEAACVSKFEELATAPVIKSMMGCLVQTSCEETNNCILALQQAANTEMTSQLRRCTDPSDGVHAVGIPAAEWANRNGSRAKRFADIASSKAKPAEMCGVAQANKWLESLTCDDGSRPVRNAEEVRAGNVGNGGRCGSIIDEYKVTCGTSTYDIFIDAYVCATK